MTPPASLLAEARALGDTAMVEWLSQWRVRMSTRVERSKLWRQLLVTYHPDKAKVEALFLCLSSSWFLFFPPT